MSSGAIWSTEAFAFESTLKQLLDSENYDLEDLLAEDELLQELRHIQYPQLLTFFSSVENVAGLIKVLISTPPKTHGNDQGVEINNVSNKELIQDSKAIQDSFNEDPDVHELTSSTDENGENPNSNYSNWLVNEISEPISRRKDDLKSKLSPQEEYEMRYIRFPFMACEIICCEIGQILDIIVEDSVKVSSDSDLKDNTEISILDLLFTIVTESTPDMLDDRRAGYLEKVLITLFKHKPIEMAAYINGDHMRINNTADITRVKSIHKGGGILLLKSFLNHLHSHSVMQIVQRLLMPRPPTSTDDYENSLSKHDEHDSTETDHDDDDDDDLIIGEEGDDMGFIKCNWVESEITLNLLLDRLIGLASHDTMDEEEILDTSQHASEILITIIQNSTLYSNIMQRMTSEPILRRLIQMSCGGIPGEIDDAEIATPISFSMHESTMTTTMSVLESLVLQLGGYGAVPTMGSVVEGGDGEQGEEKKDEKGVKSCSIIDGNTMASVTSLLNLLPSFLSSLSNLMAHPNTTSWTSPVQYSSEPQKLLGASRLKIVRLIESLVLLGNKEVDHALCQSDALELCLDLFWEFKLCSVLHQSVANLLVHVLEGGVDRFHLQRYFIFKCNLLQRLMDSFTDSSTLPSLATLPVNSGEQLSSQNYPTVEDVITSNAVMGSTASLDTENGSTSSLDEVLDASDNEGDDTIVITNADVCATTDDFNELKMKQQQQPHEAEVANNVDLDQEKKINGDELCKETPLQTNQVLYSAIPVRAGYMGHIIIICQALVQACSTSEETNSKNVLNGDESNQDTTCDKADTIYLENILNNNIEYDTISHHATSDSKVSLQGNAQMELSNINQKLDSTANVSVQREYEIVTIPVFIQEHPLFLQWQNFVSSTLASEIAVQSTNFGGNISHDQFKQNTSLIPEEFMNESSCNYDDDNIFSSCGGEIDLDDAEMDIAASMMEALPLPTSNIIDDDNDGIDDFSSHRRHRRSDVLAGQAKQKTNGAVFGASVQMHRTTVDYIYDDPLGCSNEFNAFDMIQGESNNDDDFNNGADDDDGDVPVMDLFVSSNQDPGDWANFDDAFGGQEAASSFNPVDFTTGVNGNKSSDNWFISDHTPNANDPNLFAVTEELFGTGNDVNFNIVDSVPECLEDKSKKVEIKPNEIAVSNADIDSSVNQ